MGLRLRTIFSISFAILLIFESTACRRPQEATDVNTITLYGFSVMEEPMEKAIFPAFQKEWLEHTGRQIKFASSFAGSEMVTNQIVSGVPADVAIVAIERNAVRLKNFGATKTDWHQFPYEGIINRSPFVIVVRKGNPKKIKDFADLANPGVKLIHPDPNSSGGAMWSLLAIYGSELMKSEQETGVRDTKRAEVLLNNVWRNVIATPESARQARTQFESGFGDAIVTYELEALQMHERKTPIEIIVPASTIFSEHTVVMIDRRMAKEKREVVDAFIKFLWSDTAQKAFVKYNFHSITDEEVNDAETKFGKILLPFSINDLGGWARAYPEIIEGVWMLKIQSKH
jgi:sulfate/thiosulfate transport system substrate-binding protein